MVHQLRSAGAHDDAGLNLGFVFFFPLHASVLEPDFDLSLRQTQGVSDLDPAPTRQVAVEMKFLLQLEGLVAGVRLSASLPLCNKIKNNNFNQQCSHWRQKIYTVKSFSSTLNKQMAQI